MVNWCHLVENWIRIVVQFSVIDTGGPKGFRCFLFFVFLVLKTNVRIMEEGK